MEQLHTGHHTALARKKLKNLSYLEGGDITHPHLLFLHGIPGSSHMWRPVAAQLLQDYHVILLDLPGFGQSDPQPGDYYMEELAEAIEDFVHQLGLDNLILAAHDFGGPIAIHLITREYIDIRALVLSNTNLFTDTPVPLFMRTASIPLLGPLSYSILFGSRLGLLLMYMMGTRNKEAYPRSDFQEELHRECRRQTARIFLTSLRDLEANYSLVHQALDKLQLPVLVLWSDSDPFFSQEIGERLQSIIPQAELRIYQDTGHFVPSERPHQVARDISTFLQ